MIDKKTGKIVRGRYKTLKLDELSAVDNPAQPGALMTLMKRDQSFDQSILLKSLADANRAQTFVDILSEQERQDRKWKIYERLSPAINAVRDSIQSIIQDENLSDAEQQEAIQQSVKDFLIVIREKAPEVEAEIEKFLSEAMSDASKGVSDMKTEVEKAVEEAVAKVAADLAKANETIAELEKAASEAKATIAKMEEEKEKADEALEEMKKAQGDEVLKAGDTEIRKSVVGEAVFTAMKAQSLEVAKANERAELATLEKRASTEFAHVTGTDAEKASVLKAVAAMPEDVKKSFDAILASAEKMASSAFETLGRSHDEIQNIRKAAGDFDGKVSEIAKRDDIPRHEAMTKARKEYPDLYDAKQAA